MRLAWAAILVLGAWYLYSHRTPVQAPPPPEPAPLVLPAASVLTLGDIAKVRLSAADMDPDVRWAAIQLLVALKDPQVISVIEEVVKEDREPELRRKALELLPRTKNLQVMAPIIRALADPEKAVRVEALRSIGKIGDPAALPWVTEALKDQETDVKIEALRTLGHFQDERKEKYLALAEQLRKDYEEAVSRSRQQSSPFGLPVQTPGVK